MIQSTLKTWECNLCWEIIFAGAESDLKALGFPDYKKYGDIQSFFDRFSDESFPESVELKILSNIILICKIQENSYDSVIDSRITLLLYWTIPVK